MSIQFKFLRNCLSTRMLILNCMNPNNFSGDAKTPFCLCIRVNRTDFPPKRMKTTKSAPREINTSKRKPYKLTKRKI